MEEVDKIIIHNLRQIGCEIDDNIRSIKQFDSDNVVNAMVRCLETVNPDLSLPHSMPPNMAARYKMGQDIAQACIDLGYTGDIGYQTFLYSGESDIRKILMFLVEKLPKEEENVVREPTGTELLLKKIKCKVKDELSRPWLPFSVLSDTCYSYQSVTDHNMMPAQSWKRFWKEDLFSGVIEHRHLLPTLVTLHSRGVLARYEPQWFVSKKPIIPSTSTTSVENFSTESITAKRKPTLLPKPKPNLPATPNQDVIEPDSKDLEEERIAASVAETNDDIAQLLLKKLKLEEDNAADKQALAVAREKNAMKAKILEMLPLHEDNQTKLQAAIEHRTKKLVSLANQWENHRRPLIAKYRECIEANSSRESEAVKKAEAVRSVVARRKELEIELAGKEQLLGQLQTEVARLGKDAPRAAYTKRILEIIGNIDKQKLEIVKVLKDTQEVQKTINTLSGQLDRCFTLADETIFADAKKDEPSRRAYKLLATLHSDCGQIVAMIQSTGAATRDLRDLQDQIDKERSKDVAGKLARITADLAQIKEENEGLSKQIQYNKAHPRPASTEIGHLS